jgi:hypothetical protein
LDTEGGVSKLFSNINQVKEMRFFSGDFGACDLIIDLEEALEKAPITDIQRIIIDLYYYKDLTQVETSHRLSYDYGIEITQQGVNAHLKSIHKRLAKYYEEGKETE